jgi:hypothetical protein
MHKNQTILGSTRHLRIAYEAAAVHATPTIQLKYLFSLKKFFLTKRFFSHYFLY